MGLGGPWISMAAHQEHSTKQNTSEGWTDAINNLPVYLGRVLSVLIPALPAPLQPAGQVPTATPSACK